MLKAHRSGGDRGDVQNAGGDPGRGGPARPTTSTTSRTSCTSRDGVEAFVEPRTTVTDTTVVLVAEDGEWTRRRVNGPGGAASFAKKHRVPLYDVGRVGYPQRMRDWNARHKRPR